MSPRGALFSTRGSDVSRRSEKSGWRRLLLSDAVPYTARATFFYELVSAPLTGVYFAHKEDVPKYMGLHCTLTGIRGLVAPFVGVALMGAVGVHGVFLAAVGGFIAAEIIAVWAARGEQREAADRGSLDAGDDEAAT